MFSFIESLSNLILDTILSTFSMLTDIRKSSSLSFYVLCKRSPSSVKWGCFCHILRGTPAGPMSQPAAGKKYGITHILGNRRIYETRLFVFMALGKANFKVFCYVQKSYIFHSANLKILIKFFTTDTTCSLTHILNLKSRAWPVLLQ